MIQSNNTRLTDQQFKQKLFEKLNAGNEAAHKKTPFWRLLQTNFQIDKLRSLRLHDTYYPEWTALQTKAVEQTTIAKTIEKTNHLLQTKTGKIDWYIHEILRIEAQLRGDVNFTFLIHTKAFPSHDAAGNFQLPIQVQDLLRRTLREYISELSRLNGEYVTKIAETDGDGNDRAKFDVGKVPTEVLFELAKHLKQPQ